MTVQMRHFNLLVFISVFLLSGSVLKSQNRILYQNTQELAWLYNQQSGVMNGSQEVQQIMNLLSNRLNKNLYAVEYSLRWGADTRLMEVYPGNYQLSVSSRFFQMTGDTGYQSFSIARQLWPDQYSFQLHLINPMGQSIRQWNIGSSEYREDGLIAAFSHQDTLSFAGCRLELRNTIATYSSQAPVRLRKRLELIHDYWNTGLDARIQQLQTLAYGDPDQYAQCRNAVDQQRSFMVGLDQKRIPQELNLVVSDPARFVQKYQELKGLVDQGDARLNEGKRQYAGVYYQRGKQWYPYDLVQAERCFLKAHEFEKFATGHLVHAPSELMMCHIQLKRNQPDSASRRLVELRRTFYLNLSDSEKINAMMLAQDLFQRQLKLSSQEIQKKNHRDAISQISKARDLCNGFGLTGCVDSCDKYNAMAWKSVYQGYIDESKTALQKKDFDKAIEKAEDALRTARNNPKEIPDDKTARNQMLKVRQEQYNIYMSSGKTLAASKDFTSALKKYDSAIYIIETFGVVPAADQQKVITQSAKPTLLKQLDWVGSMLMINLNSGRQEFEKAQKLVERYGLKDDKEIRNALNALAGKVTTQECRWLGARVDSLYILAENEAASGQYLKAEKGYLFANQVADSIPRCSIPKAKGEKRLQELAPAIKYQKDMESAQELVKREQFEQAIKTYEGLESYFQQEVKGKYSIERLSVADWILKQNNSLFCIGASQYYRGAPQQLDLSIMFMKKAVQMGYPNKSTRVLQTMLGGQLALRDASNNPSALPDMKVVEYTEGQSWMKTFKKAYVKQFKASIKK